MLVFALVSLSLTTIALVIALAQPHLELPPGAVPTSLNDISIIETDLLEKPDQLSSYAAIKAFRARQGILRAELEGAQVLTGYALPDGTGTREGLDLRPRTLSDLPGAFWFQNIVGLVSALIGGWVLGLRPMD